MSIQEKQLGQLRPSGVTAVTLYSPPAATTWVGKNLVICNTSGAPATYRIFHDEDGTTHDETTALFWNAQIEATETISVTGLMAGFTDAGSIGVRSSVANALTFTLYGAEMT